MASSSQKLLTTIGIVDIGLSNLGSIERSLSEICDRVTVVRNPEQLRGLDRLVLPGVGAFSVAMGRLRESGLADPISSFIRDLKRPTLGICLGMQLLADLGEEHGLNHGLGLIPGRVRKFDPQSNVRIPHVGWNSVDVRIETPLFAGIPPGQDFYFVHSYVFDLASNEYLAASATNGQTFVAAIQRSNLVGVQFHPEKSSRVGRKLLENFCRWDPC